jgi:ADP-heptose:LPS heptosyltransferase
MNPYAGGDSLCIVFLHGIGDFVMFTPTLKKIKTLNPGLKLTLVLRKELALKRLAENLGVIDEVLELSLEKHPRFYVPWIFWTSEYWKIRKRLSHLMEKKKYSRIIIVYAQLMPTIFYLLFCPKKIRTHKIESLAGEAGIKLTEQEKNNTFVNIPEGVRSEIRNLLRESGAQGKTLIGIQRNTMDKTRAIPFKAVQELISALNQKFGTEKLFFLVFANEDSYGLEAKVDGGHLAFPNLKYSLHIKRNMDSLELAGFVDTCDWVLSIDSAVFNLAGALGKKTIGIFPNYKVRSTERALRKPGIISIDKPKVTPDELMRAFLAFAGGALGGGTPVL